MAVYMQLLKNVFYQNDLLEFYSNTTDKKYEITTISSETQR